MKLNVDKVKEVSRAKADATRAKRATRAQAAPDSTPSVPRASGSTYRGRGYQDLDEYLASGDFRRLIIRPDGRDGGSWTLKGMLLVRERSIPVYMHGRCASLADIRPLIDRLLRAGDWHEDRYPSKEDV